MTYTDGMEIELFDHVEVSLDGFVHDGQVTAIFPRSNAIRVRYLDRFDTRRDGEPKSKTTRVFPSAIELERRDG